MRVSAANVTYGKTIVLEFLQPVIYINKRYQQYFSHLIIKVEKYYYWFLFNSELLIIKSKLELVVILIDSQSLIIL